MTEWIRGPSARPHAWLASAAFTALALLAGACSVSVSLGEQADDAAVELIETDLASRIGLGDLEASCTDAGDVEAGDPFLCTAMTEDGRVIEFEAILRDDDSVDVDSTNLVLADSVPLLEEAAVAALEESVGATLGVSNYDCGDDTIIVPPTGEVVCILTDPADGARYESTITMGPGFESIESVVVAETPMP